MSVMNTRTDGRSDTQNGLTQNGLGALYICNTVKRALTMGKLYRQLFGVLQLQVQVFIDTLADQRPNNLIKQEKV